ncbi:MAG: efflux RND transporter periplasmic adaptor subunit [Bacteroidales bacterium]|nr:efflux RND transporter periplasmic adaptor subunit [Bacteroidales bacterium]
MSSCKQRQDKIEKANYPVMEIVTANKSFKNSYSAAIRGRQDIDIYPQVGGFISQVCITEGARVTKGQTLFVIDQVPFKAALNTAAANVETAKAGVATAQLVFNSKKELFDKKVISQFDLSVAENGLLTAKAQLAQAEAQEIIARNNLSYTTVKSPSSGVVGILPFKVGALVSPSQPRPLTTISDNSVMYVYFSLTENQLLSLIREHQSMEKAINALPQVELQLSDGSVYEEKGKIESVSGVIDAVTGTVSLRAVFPNPSRLLHSGGAGNVIIPHEEPDCIAIPKSATFEVQDRLYVYKKVDGVAKSVQIEAIPANATEYIVKAGLQKGDIIVLEGTGFIRENTLLN